MHVLIIESASTSIKMLEEAQKRNYLISIVRGPPGTVFRNQLLDNALEAFSDSIKEADVGTFEAFRNAVLETHALKRIDAIVSLSEYNVEFASLVAQELNIPFTSANAVELAKDKFSLKRALADGGKAYRNEVATSIQTAEAAVAIVGFPCVVKPRKGAASLNTWILHTEKDLQQMLRKNSDLPPGFDKLVSAEIVVERFHDGQMYSIEVAQVGSNVKLMTVSHRYRAEESQVIELGTLMPCTLGDDFWRKCEKFANNIVNCVGLNLGIYHIEVIYSSGELFLIEVNPRLMGGSLPDLYLQTHEQSVFSHVLDVYCERIMPELPTAKRHGLSCMLAAAQTSELPASFDLSLTTEFQKYGMETTFFKQPGAKVDRTESNHGYLGKFLIFSKSATELRSVRDRALSLFSAMLGTQLYSPEKSEVSCVIN